MDPLAANLVLLAALLHACWNTLIKIKEDRLAVMGMITAWTAGIAFLVLLWLPMPGAGVWPYIGVSVILHGVYRLTLIRAYRDGDLSQVYPIARGTAPILVLIFAFVFTGETMSPLSVFAIILACLAIVSLALHRGPAADKAIRDRGADWWPGVFFVLGRGGANDRCADPHRRRLGRAVAVQV